MNPEETEEEIRRLLVEMPEPVRRHVEAVAEFAVELAERRDADVDTVRAAALLHDVGRMRSHGVDHVAEGVRLLEERGFPGEVVSAVESHVGAGLTDEEAEGLGLPPGNYMPESAEARIVAYADNRFRGSEKLSFEEALHRFRSRVDNEEAVERFRELHREIANN